MRKRFVYIAFHFILFIYPNVSAALTVRTDYNEKRNHCIKGIKSQICTHIFEQERFIIHVKKDKSDDMTYCKTIDVVLLQISSKMEALIPNVAQPKWSKLCTDEMQFNIDIPSVRHETEFELVVREENNKGIMTPFYAKSLKVYPHSILEYVKKWANSPENLLIVYDTKGQLSSFLDQHNITYSPYDLKQTWLNKIYLLSDSNYLEIFYKLKGNTVYLTDNDLDTLLMFVEGDIKMPTGNTTIKILSELNFDDPVALKSFANLFYVMTK